MPTPKPGAQVRGSESGSPINALFDLLGRRWTLGILWYLGDSPRTFRDLQDRCGGVSPSILNSRLKELRDAEIVARAVEGYILTERGTELRSFIVPLTLWSFNWAQQVYGYERPGMRERLARESSNQS